MALLVPALGRTRWLVFWRSWPWPCIQPPGHWAGIMALGSPSLSLLALKRGLGDLTRRAEAAWGQKCLLKLVVSRRLLR